MFLVSAILIVLYRPCLCPNRSFAFHSFLLYFLFLSLQSSAVWSAASVAMGAGAFLEPLAVVVLLFGGTWINRSVDLRSHKRRNSGVYSPGSSPDLLETGLYSPTTKGPRSPRSSSPPSFSLRENRWHKRRIGIFGSSFLVTSPNTDVFQDRLLSRLLQKLPFLAECWYWALIYWVCVLCGYPCIFYVTCTTFFPKKRTNVSVVDIPAGSSIHCRHSPGRNR